VLATICPGCHGIAADTDSLCGECNGIFRSIAAGLTFVASAVDDVTDAELDGELAALIALDEPLYVC
jgi:hypothetical protein